MAVVGSVGAGKSSLLSAILGEMEKLSGVVNVDVRINALYLLIMNFYHIQMYQYNQHQRGRPQAIICFQFQISG